MVAIRITHSTRILAGESQMMTEYYGKGVWHALIRLGPQYDHIEGTPIHEEYMKGYNETLEDMKSERDSG